MRVETLRVDLVDLAESQSPSRPRPQMQAAAGTSLLRGDAHLQPKQQQQSASLPACLLVVGCFGALTSRSRSPGEMGKEARQKRVRESQAQKRSTLPSAGEFMRRMRARYNGLAMLRYSTLCLLSPSSHKEGRSGSNRAGGCGSTASARLTDWLQKPGFRRRPAKMLGVSPRTFPTRLRKACVGVKCKKCLAPSSGHSVWCIATRAPVGEVSWV